MLRPTGTRPLHTSLPCCSPLSLTAPLAARIMRRRRRFTDAIAAWHRPQRLCHHKGTWFEEYAAHALREARGTQPADALAKLVARGGARGRPARHRVARRRPAPAMGAHDSARRTAHAD